MTELEGLFSKGVLQVVHASEAEGFRIYSSRFVNTVKNEGTPDEIEKSRLVVQAYNDKLHACLLTPLPFSAHRNVYSLPLQPCALSGI